MPIQYPCPGCSQPIEVDEELAGRAAACPYCGRVAVAPEQATLEAAQIATARPVRGVAGDDAVGVSAQPGRRLGLIALGCAVAAVVLFGGTIVYLSAALVRDLQPTATSQPSADEVSAALERIIRAAPWLSLPLIASLAIAAVGASFAVRSLRLQPRGNWPANVGLLFCGLLLVCGLSNVLLSIVPG